MHMFCEKQSCYKTVVRQIIIKCNFIYFLLICWRNLRICQHYQVVQYNRSDLRNKTVGAEDVHATQLCDELIFDKL